MFVDEKEIEEKPVVEEQTPSQEADLILKLKEKVDKLETENKQLNEAKRDYYNKVINQVSPKDNTPIVEKRSKQDIVKDMKDLVKKNGSNRDYIKLALELDDAVIAETGQSVFLSNNTQETPKSDEIQAAKKTRELFEYAIEESEGNPDAFNMILSKHIIPIKLKRV